MKVLFVTNQVYSFAKSNEMIFSLLSELGHDVVWAGNFKEYKGDITELPCKTIQVDFASNPFKATNIKAFKQLRRAISDESIDAIHCNTPIGGFLGRLAGKSCGINPIIYSAHGFLFYEGAPFVNRSLYYLEEKLLSRITDVLITINEEDHRKAQDFRLRGDGSLYLVHGAGVEVDVDCESRDAHIREELGLEDKILCFSAARIDRNKNIDTVLTAFQAICNRDIHYVVAGDGSELSKLKDKASALGISDRVHFLGYRLDVSALLNEMDIFILSSFREGLSRSVMEAMAHGLPCVLSRARGNQDLVQDGVGGFICETDEPARYANAIQVLALSPDLRSKMSQINKQSVRGFSLERVKEEHRLIYRKHLSSCQGDILED